MPSTARNANGTVRSKQSDRDFQRHEAERRRREGGTQDRMGQRRAISSTTGSSSLPTAPPYRDPPINSSTANKWTWSPEHQRYYMAQRDDKGEWSYIWHDSSRDPPIYDRPNYDRPNYDRPNYDRPNHDLPVYDRPIYDHTINNRPTYINPYSSPATCLPHTLPAPPLLGLHSNHRLNPQGFNKQPDPLFSTVPSSREHWIGTFNGSQKPQVEPTLLRPERHGQPQMQPSFGQRDTQWQPMNVDGYPSENGILGFDEIPTHYQGNLPTPQAGGLHLVPEVRPTGLKTGHVSQSGYRQHMPFLNDNPRPTNGGIGMYMQLRQGSVLQ